MTVRLALSDDKWSQLATLIARLRLRGPRGRDDRRFVEAVLWITRTGTPWRDLPEQFGKWSTVYRRFRRWAVAGHWQALRIGLAEGVDEDALLLIDSTIVKAHPHAACATVALPKIGTLVVREDTRRLRRMLRNGRAKILFATVSRQAGRWTIQLNVEAAPLHPKRRHQAKLDRAARIDSPRPLRTAGLLEALQRVRLGEARAVTVGANVSLRGLRSRGRPRPQCCRLSCAMVSSRREARGDDKRLWRGQR